MGEQAKETQQSWGALVGSPHLDTEHDVHQKGSHCKWGFTQGKGWVVMRGGTRREACARNG